MKSKWYFQKKGYVLPDSYFGNPSCRTNTETFTMAALDIGQYTLHLQGYLSSSGTHAGTGGEYDLRVICDTLSTSSPTTSSPNSTSPSLFTRTYKCTSTPKMYYCFRKGITISETLSLLETAQMQSCHSCALCPHTGELEKARYVPFGCSRNSSADL